MLMDSQKHFPTGTSVKPLWLRQNVADIPFVDAEILSIIAQNDNIITLADLINYATEYSQIMAYSNNWNIVKDLAGKMRTSAQKFGRKSEFIIETGNVVAEETLHAELVANSSQFYANFAEFASEFPEVVVHDYRQFYESLHCNEPVVWKVL